jgi:hypothetical protein
MERLMGPGLWLALLAVTVGLAINEYSDLSPRLARRITSWAARRWTDDPVEVAGYEEEWAALIDARSGKLFKVVTAVAFATRATMRWQRRQVEHRLATTPTPGRTGTDRRLNLR